MPTSCLGVPEDPRALGPECLALVEALCLTWHPWSQTMA